VRITTADLEDTAHARALLDVLDSYASDPVGGGKALAADVRARLVPGLKAQPNAVAVLAFDGDVPVGLAVCFFGFSTFKARPLLNIHDLAVVPDYRGRGIGRLLLGHVEGIARERGCCKLTLEVQDANARARGLYSRFGFTDFVVGEQTATRFLEKAL
jgi:ribosomal protein S18 acetylase RimI-like enzyme